MSTRAYIRIKKDGEGAVHFHHHFDGYPSGVGSDLVDILTQFTGDWSPAKLGAFINEKDDNFEFVNNGPSCDHEYLYLIDCDKMELSCYYKGITSESENQQDYFCADKLFIEGNIFDGRETEPAPSTISVDWSTFRREAAKDALCQIIRTYEDYRYIVPEDIARRSVACADELIKQLKEEEK